MDAAHRRLLHVRPEHTGRSPPSPLLPVNPGRTLDEPLHRLLRHREAIWAQSVAQEIDSPLDAPDEGLLRMLLKPERGEGLVHDLGRPPQLPARWRKHHDVVHVANEEEPRSFEAFVQLAEEESTE